MYKKRSMFLRQNDPTKAEKRRIERLDSKGSNNFDSDQSDLVVVCSACNSTILRSVRGKRPNCPRCDAKTAVVDGKEYFGTLKFPLVQEFMKQAGMWQSSKGRHTGERNSPSIECFLLEIQPKAKWKASILEESPDSQITIVLSQVPSRIQAERKISFRDYFNNLTERGTIAARLSRELFREIERSALQQSGKWVTLGDLIGKDQVSSEATRTTLAHEMPQGDDPQQHTDTSKKSVKVSEKQTLKPKKGVQILVDATRPTDGTATTPGESVVAIRHLMERLGMILRERQPAKGDSATFQEVLEKLRQMYRSDKDSFSEKDIETIQRMKEEFGRLTADFIA